MEGGGFGLIRLIYEGKDSHKESVCKREKRHFSKYRCMYTCRDTCKNVYFNKKETSPPSNPPFPRN